MNDVTYIHFKGLPVNTSCILAETIVLGEFQPLNNEPAFALLTNGNRMTPEEQAFVNYLVNV